MLASEIEIERIRKNNVEWRLLVRGLLRQAEQDALRDKDFGFLESLSARTWQEQLSYRQAEWLLDIRTGVERVSSYMGFSLRSLMQGCYESRFGLDDEDQVWIAAIHESGRTSLRRNEARRIYNLAKHLGEIDGD